MQIPKKIFDLLQALNVKTTEKKINWYHTSIATEFRTDFKTGGALTIDSYINQSTGTKWADFAVYNANGEQIERIVHGEGTEDYEILLALYQNIQKSFLRIDETYDSIFNDLNKL